MVYLDKKTKRFPVHTPDPSRPIEEFVEVIEVIDKFDPLTEKLGPYSEPDIRHVDTGETDDKGNPIYREEWFTERKKVERTEEQMASLADEHWQDVRLARNEELCRTDILLLKKLEEQLPDDDELRVFRQSLRDLPSTDTDPTKIKVPKFK